MRPFFFCSDSLLQKIAADTLLVDVRSRQSPNRASHKIADNHYANLCRIAWKFFSF